MSPAVNGPNAVLGSVARHAVTGKGADVEVHEVFSGLDSSASGHRREAA